MNLSKPTPTGIENCQNLHEYRPSKTFCGGIMKQKVVPTLEAMQKMIALYHDKNFDMLKLVCTSTNLAYIRLHKTTGASF